MLLHPEVFTQAAVNYEPAETKTGGLSGLLFDGKLINGRIDVKPIWRATHKYNFHQRLPNHHQVNQDHNQSDLKLKVSRARVILLLTSLFQIEGDDC